MPKVLWTSKKTLELNTRSCRLRSSIIGGLGVYPACYYTLVNPVVVGFGKLIDTGDILTF